MERSRYYSCNGWAAIRWVIYRFVGVGGSYLVGHIADRLSSGINRLCHSNVGIILSCLLSWGSFLAGIVDYISDWSLDGYIRM